MLAMRNERQGSCVCDPLALVGGEKVVGSTKQKKNRW